MIEEIVFVAEIFREEQIILKFLYDAGKIILQSLYILNHMFLSGTWRRWESRNDSISSSFMLWEI